MSRRPSRPGRRATVDRIDITFDGLLRFAASRLPANQRMEPTEPDVFPSARRLGRRLIRTLCVLASRHSDTSEYLALQERSESLALLWGVGHAFFVLFLALALVPRDSSRLTRDFGFIWPWECLWHFGFFRGFLSKTPLPSRHLLARIFLHAVFSNLSACP